MRRGAHKLYRMPSLRPVAWIALCLLLTSCAQKAPSAKLKPKQKTAEPRPIPVASIDQPAVDVPLDLRWLLIGGGADPLSNQVSLAQDVQFAQSVLGGRGLTLFASGPSAQLAVDARAQHASVLTLREHLAGLFGVPGALVTRYEPARLAIDGPATRDQVLSAIQAALVPGEGPLLVYATCHGDRGTAPRENSLSLWGGQSLQVAELAKVLEREATRRSVRLVITSCYGGGFADLIFQTGDETRGLGTVDQCGLFAAPWDDEASGCDPNPDRRAQESYAIHFWHALLGEDRQQRSRAKDIDLDADGSIGLLEAHTWARIHAASFDVPTNTSERYLRKFAPGEGKIALDAVAAPEEVAVIRALGAKLELDTERAARDKLTEIDQTLAELGELVEQAQAVEDDSYQALRIGLLERWPLLEHPWEERTQRLLSKKGSEILRMLTSSTLAESHATALRDLDEVTLQHDGARVERARVLRLVQAFETLRLATALKSKGGPGWERYERIRRCERWAPVLKRDRG